MALIDIWDYVRASGDRRLRQQGYVTSGSGILERYRRVPGFWGPHLEQNRKNLLGIVERMGAECSGTLVILGAGRLLDVPWEQIFPRFKRVVLVDADYSLVPYVERLMSTTKASGIPKPEFEIGDLTASVVDVSAWSEHTIRASTTASAAAKALGEGFDKAGASQPQWARTFPDVRLIVSTNLLSQLGYFPRLYIQTEFRKRFGHSFDGHGAAAESLERYFDRVRARHIFDIASIKNAWAYLSTDIDTVVYSLDESVPPLLTSTIPPNAGVELDSKNELKMSWPSKITEHSDPLHGQRVKALWPQGTRLDLPKRWAWHIVPQGSEKKYQACGRVHIVESWTKLPG